MPRERVRRSLDPNSTVDKKKRRRENLSCSFCPPNRKENCKIHAKHGPKKKQKRRV